MDLRVLNTFGPSRMSYIVSVGAAFQFASQTVIRTADELSDSELYRPGLVPGFLRVASFEGAINDLTILYFQISKRV